MNNKSRMGEFWPLSGIFLFIAAVSTIFLYEKPLKTSRPTVADGVEREIIAIEDVQARLWQDPFAAAYKDLKERQEKDDTQNKDLKKRQEEDDTQNKALEKRQEKGDTQHHDEPFKKLKDMIHAKVSHKKDKSVTIIAVMVFGGPYVEDAENRMRLRYASLSGLRVAGYIPEDEQHIGYILPNSKDESWWPQVMPYEWFEANGDNHPPLLLLWLDDDAFRKSPIQTTIQKLLRLVEEIKLIEQEDNKEKKYNASIKFIGPAGSTNLEDIVASYNPDSEQKAEFELEFYSYAATVWGEYLTDNGKQVSTSAFYECDSNNDKQEWDKVTADRKNKVNTRFGVKLLRTIGSDRDQARALLCELKRRGVDIVCSADDDECRSSFSKPCTPPVSRPAELNPNSQPKTNTSDTLPPRPQDHIVLVAEWDTFYGRTLPRTFIDLVADMRCEFYEKTHPNVNKVDVKEWIHRFSYLRGMDGLLPGDKPNNVSTVKSRKEENDNAQHDRIERPEDKSQLDYLRRLAYRVDALDKELKQAGEGGIKAVGVLGSDVYDKLLVLQALRPKLPGVLFFTIDLDARFLHPDELPWTRNLIISSSFGLRLHDKIQQDVPPFRDSYQSSLFLTMLIALDRIHKVMDVGNRQDGQTHQIPLTQEDMNHLLDPRIYEVGWHGAADLSVDSCLPTMNCWEGQLVLQNADESTVTLDGLHPPRSDTRPRFEIWILTFLAITLLSALLWVLSYRVQTFFTRSLQTMFALKRTQSPEEFLHRRGFLLFCVFIVLILALSFALVYGVLLISTRPQEEPYTWFDGISIWPAEILRFLGGLISVFLVIKGYQNLKDNHIEISQFNHLIESEITQQKLASQSEEAQPPTSKPSSRLSDRWNQLLRRWRVEELRMPQTIQDVWCEYLKLGSFRHRIAGVLFLSILYFSLGIVIMLAVGFPATPSRGPLSQGLDIAMLIFGVVAFVFLNFFVVDATRLCERRLIRPLIKLNYDEAVWPKGEHNPVLNRWRALELVASRTEAVQKLVIYPFLIIVILMLSRSAYFDRWQWSLGLIIVITIHLFFALSSAVIMRRGAEELREVVRDDMSTLLVIKRGSGHASDHHLADQAEQALLAIDRLQKGAFTPWSQQPLVRALLLPFGGLGGLKLMDFLATSQW